MKKKKLKQRIEQLESQLETAKSREWAWEDTSHRFIEELMECGVKTEIIYPELLVIETSQFEDDAPRYAGINTAPPTLSFDFTEHDKTVIRTYLRGINLRGINHGKE